VCKFECLLCLHLPKAVEIELPDEAFELGLSEVEWQDVALHPQLVDHFDGSLVVRPRDDLVMGWVLLGGRSTARRQCSLLAKLPLLMSFIFEKDYKNT
jgi:hypothetical protein